MKRTKHEGLISFSLNGGREVTLTGQEFADLVAKKRKPAPLTKPQSDTQDLFREFVKRGMGRG